MLGDMINCIVFETKDGQDIGIEALTDQVVIEEDKFRTGYECKECNGECYLNESCDLCKGTGRESVGTLDERLCRKCCPKHMLDTSGTQPGKKICPVCEGKGSLIIAPQNAQLRPTSGIVKSIGNEVKILSVGDRVLYSMFAGTVINLKQKAVIRIMHEHEIMCRLWGIAKLGDLIK